MSPEGRSRALLALLAALGLLALLGSLFAPAAALGLLALPPLAALSWRSERAFQVASACCAAALGLGLAGNLLAGGRTQGALAAAGALAATGAASLIARRRLRLDENRSQAQRRSLDALEAELARLAEQLEAQEKSLAISENRRRRYSRLQDAVAALGGSLELERLAELTLQQAAQLLAGLRLDLTLFLLDEGGAELLRVSRSLDGQDPYPEAKPAAADPLNAWVLEKGASLVVRDLARDFRFRGLDLQSLRGRCFHLLPLLNADGGAEGLLRVESRVPECLEQEDLSLLESLGVMASLAFANAKLYRRTLRLAVSDGLTGLLLRKPLLERLEEELGRAAAQGAPLSLLLLDLDHFKAVNDAFGHPAGDGVLKRLAGLLQRCVRDVDVCSRWGGEEFVVLLPRTSLEGARLAAERIREALAAQVFELGGAGRRLTLSLGAAQSWAGCTPQDLIAAADAALYQAKQAGRDRVCLAPEAA